MNKILKEKIFMAFSSVLPITIIVLAASVFFAPLPSDMVLMFLAGAGLLVVGMGFFTLGADMSLRSVGEGIGVQLTKGPKLVVVILITFVMGMIITIAEPDLVVLARQVENAIPYWHLMITVSAGIGVMLVVAVLRTLFKIRLSILLIIFYAIIFGICQFAPELIVPFAFEAGGIATGPIMVPFVLAIGMGLASVRSDKDSLDESFGLTALTLIGPVLAMLVLGIFHMPSGLQLKPQAVYEAVTSRDVVTNFALELPVYLKEISIAIGCILFCLFVFQIVSRRYHAHQLIRIIVGFLYALIGLTLFLTGLSVGFVPAGRLLGLLLASSQIKWLLIPLGMVIGYFLVTAEPEVFILNLQVEEISKGVITAKMMNRGLAISMALALGLTMTRILLGIPLMWILIPGYALALLLTFFVPKIFTGIAFDSGAVCSGPISVTFLLPLAMGVAEGAGKDQITYAVGIVIIVAMMPTIVIQLMGLLYHLKAREAAAMTKRETAVINTIATGKDFDWGKITEFDVNTQEKRKRKTNGKKN